MGCFSKPKVEAQSTLDPNLQRHIMDPMIGQMREHLFGLPGMREGMPWLGGQTLPGREPVPGAFTGAAPTWAFGGPRVAGASPLQQQAFNWAGQLPGQTQAMQGMGMNLLGQMPNFDATRQHTAMLWDRDIAPSVMERFAGAGNAMSGGAMQAMGRAGGQMALGLASQLAPMELQAKQGAAAMLPAMHNMGLSGMQASGLFGAEQRGIQQQQLDANRELWHEQQPWAHPMLNLMFPTAQATQRQLTQQPGGMGYSFLTGVAPAVAGAGLGLAFGGPAGAAAVLGGMNQR